MFVMNSAMKKAAGVLAAAFTLAAGYFSYNMVNSAQFGLKETFGILDTSISPSGLYLNLPIVSYTHSYQINTQTIEFNAGSCRFIPVCDSTVDRNPLTATIALQYKVKQDVTDLSYHRWAMDGWVMPDGYWLVSGLMNDSANAVLGKATMLETLQASHEQFLEEFRVDFTNRLQQNNIPVDIESLELKGFNTLFPAKFPTYQLYRASTPP